MPPTQASDKEAWAAGPSAHAPRLSTSEPGFESAFAAFLAAKRETSEDVDAAVRAIIADVRQRGRLRRCSS